MLPKNGSCFICFTKLWKLLQTINFDKPDSSGEKIPPFWGGLFGGAYVRRENCVSKLIGLAYSWDEICRFCFVLLCIWRQFPSTSPGALIFGGAIKRRDFCLMSLGELIFGGAYTWRGLVSEFYGSFYPANILSQQKSEKWYIIHLNKAVVFPLAYCLLLPAFVWDR